jgi:hypothetical protein
MAFARASQSDNVSDVTKPLDYWRSQCHIYPSVAAVALKVFSEPASAVFPEQNWSIAGFLTKDSDTKTPIA